MRTQDMFRLFDSVAFVSYTGSVNKCRRMCDELIRVGIDDFGVEMNVPTPFDGVLHKALKTGMNLKYVNSTLGHYRIVKRAYELGKRSVLVMEDDCRFPQSLSWLEEGLNDLPVGFDLALLDSVQPYRAADDDYHRMVGARINKSWCRLNVKRVSVACYALSRNGMERFIGMIERSVGGTLSLRAADQYLEPALWGGLNCYCAVPNLAIQCRTSSTTTSYDSIANSYKKEGVLVNEYATY